MLPRAHFASLSVFVLAGSIAGLFSVPSLAVEPGNVIVVILDDIGIDELAVYQGGPLAAACGTSCDCLSGTACSNCDCTDAMSSARQPSN